MSAHDELSDAEAHEEDTETSGNVVGAHDAEIAMEAVCEYEADLAKSAHDELSEADAHDEDSEVPVPPGAQLAEMAHDAVWEYDPLFEKSE